MSIASICAAARGEAHLEAARCDPATLPKSRLGRLAAFRAQRHGDAPRAEPEEAEEGPRPELGRPAWDQIPKSKTTKPLAQNSLLKPKGGPEIKPSKPAPLPPDVRSRRASEKPEAAAEEEWPGAGAGGQGQGSQGSWRRGKEKPHAWTSKKPAERGRDGDLQGRGCDRRSGGYAGYTGSRYAGRSGQGWKEEPMMIVAAYRGYTRDFELFAGRT
ncbi:EXD2 [Symbiodinium sp. CCMP2456]|nr:EXD2 [Symbiodinium sp. CCMP2456]